MTERDGVGGFGAEDLVVGGAEVSDDRVGGETLVETDMPLLPGLLGTPLGEECELRLGAGRVRDERCADGAGCGCDCDCVEEVLCDG